MVTSAQSTMHNNCQCQNSPWRQNATMPMTTPAIPPTSMGRKRTSSPVMKVPMPTRMQIRGFSTIS